MAGLVFGSYNLGTGFFFFSSRRRHTRCSRDWSSDVCSSDLPPCEPPPVDVAQTHGNHDLPFGGLVEQYPARTLRLFLEHTPQQGLLHFAQLSKIGRASCRERV